MVVSSSGHPVHQSELRLRYTTPTDVPPTILGKRANLALDSADPLDRNKCLAQIHFEFPPSSASFSAVYSLGIVTPLPNAVPLIREKEQAAGKLPAYFSFLVYCPRF